MGRRAGLDARLDDTSMLRGTGHHLTPDQLFTFTRFFDAARLLQEALARHLADDHDMTIADYEVLVRLDGADDTMRLTELAERCVMSKSRLTHALNRLEKRGWIERRPCPDDGRGLVAVLLPAGAEALGSASPRHAELIETHLLSHLDDAEQRFIGSAMERVASHLRSVRGQ